MAGYNSKKFIEALERATGKSDGKQIKKKLVEHKEDELISALESNSYNLNGYENFLNQYRRELLSHKENAKHISQIKKNYNEIEDIYSTLQSEIETALGESTELEDISKALNDKKLLKKAEKDEAYIRDLKKKFDHLLSMKKEMESLESKLDKETEHFSNLEHAVKRRIKLIEEILENSDTGGSSSSDHMIVSISDIHGHKSRMDEALSLLSRSSNYPAIGNGDYTLVLNGDAFDDRDGKEKKSKDVFHFMEAKAGNGDFVYTFGNHDQFILFKEFWCAIHQHKGYDDPFFATIKDKNREWFINEIINGCITGVWDGNYDHNYAHASPHSNLNKTLEKAAEKVYDILTGNKDPDSIINDSEATSILNDIDSRFGLKLNGSANSIGDITPANPGDLEKIIAIQYKIQYDKYPAVFHHKNGALWVRWDDLVSSGPGKYIVGHTMSKDCSKGNSFFSDGTNPRFARSGNLINENTIRQGETSIVVEKPGGDVCALRDESGSVNEVCLSDHSP